MSRPKIRIIDFSAMAMPCSSNKDIMLTFDLLKDASRLESSKQSQARLGTITTDHGVIQTPIFMPVGTLGSVKAISVEDLDHCRAQVILGNTYHLFLRPGCEVIEHMQGLHEFIRWDKPMLTDSGGFQFFSLAKLAWGLTS